jgi:hypothetical protein
MIRVPLPGKVRHLVQAHLDNCREQALARACAFYSPFCVSMSAMGIFRQSTTAAQTLRLSDPYDKGKFDILISPGYFPASSRREVDPSHKELILRRPAGCARAVCLERRGKRIGSPATHREFRFRCGVCVKSLSPKSELLSECRIAGGVVP